MEFNTGSIYGGQDGLGWVSRRSGLGVYEGQGWAMEVRNSRIYIVSIEVYNYIKMLMVTELFTKNKKIVVVILDYN